MKGCRDTRHWKRQGDMNWAVWTYNSWRTFSGVRQLLTCIRTCLHSTQRCRPCLPCTRQQDSHPRMRGDCPLEGLRLTSSNRTNQISGLLEPNDPRIWREHTNCRQEPLSKLMSKLTGTTNICTVRQESARPRTCSIRRRYFRKEPRREVGEIIGLREVAHHECPK